MNSFIDPFRAVAEAWWPYVLHSTWQSMLVGVVILGMVWALRRSPAPLRYGLLIVALLKFVAPPMLALPTGVFGWVETPAPNPMHPAEHGTSTQLVERGPETFSESVLPIFAHPGIAAPTSQVARVDPGAPDYRTTHANGAYPGKAYLLLVHLLGSGAIAIWMLYSAVNLGRLVKRSERVVGGVLYAELVALCDRVGLRRPVRLLLAPDDSAPTAFGVFRPTVLIPAALVRNLPPHEVAPILAHEAGHHLRKDTWFIWLENLLLLVWWFNPVLWVLIRTIRKAREDCCDDLVLGTDITDNDAYGGTLVHAASNLARRGRVRAVLGFADTFHPLGRRLKRIMDTTLRRSPRLSFAGLLAVLALGLLLLPGLRIGAAEDHQWNEAPSQIRSSPEPWPQTAPSIDRAETTPLTPNETPSQTSFSREPRPQRAPSMDPAETTSLGAAKVLSGTGDTGTASVHYASVAKPTADTEPHVPERNEEPVRRSPELESGACVVYGTVTDVDGEPARGVRVAVVLRGRSGEGGRLVLDKDIPVAYTLTTLDDGTYRFEYLPDGAYVVCATTPHACAYGGQGLSSESEEYRERELDLQLRPPRETTGTVRNAQGEPVKDASVVVSGDARGLSKVLPVKSEDSGRYAITYLQKGKHNIVVSADGYALSVVENVKAGTADNDVVLDAGGSVSGTVTFKDSKEPAPGIRVVARRCFSGFEERETFTDGQGKYVLDRLSVGVPYVIFVENESEGYAAAENPDVTFLFGRSRRVDILLSRGGSISGTVTVSETGEPLPEAGISVRGSGWGSLFTRREAVSGADGTYTCSMLPAGPYTLECRSPKGVVAGNPRKWLEVDVDEKVTGVDFSFERGYSLSGRVTTVSGQPVEGAQLLGIAPGSSGGTAYVAPVARSDVNGDYVLEGLIPGSKYVIIVRARAKGYASLQLSDVLPPGKRSVSGADFVMEKGATITGRAIDAEGRPLSRGSLHLSAGGDHWQKPPGEIVPIPLPGDEVGWDEQGRFEMTDVGKGTYRFRWRRKTALNSPITVRPGQTIENIDVIFPATR